MKIPIKIRYIASSIITLCRLMETIVKALLTNIIFKFMIYISKNNGTKFAIIHIEINRGRGAKCICCKTSSCRLSRPWVKPSQLLLHYSGHGQEDNRKKNILNATQIPFMKFSYGGC